LIDGRSKKHFFDLPSIEGMKVSKKLNPIKVEIDNFQSISHLEFVINGFTCITGKSNIGKSAIVRAISSAILNSSVVGMVRKGNKSCRVHLDSEDWGFTWEKGQGKSKCDLHKSGRMLDKLGHGQIQDIRDMGFGSVRIGSHDIFPWISSQWDPLFLLKESGQSITEFISDISRLSVLQNAIKISFQRKKVHSDSLKRNSEEREAIKMKMQNYENVDKLKELRKDIDLQSESIRQNEITIEKGENLLRKSEELNESIRLINKGIEKVPYVHHNNQDLTYNIQKIENGERILRSLVRSASSLKKIIGVSKIKNIEFPKKDYDDLILAMHIHSRIESNRTRYNIETVPIIGHENNGLTDDTQELINQIRLKESIKQKIEKSKSLIKELPHQFPTLEIDEEVLDAFKIIKAMEINEVISYIRKDIESMEKEIEKENIIINEIQSIVSSIPQCPTCGKPLEIL
jgi:hypothetical protein